MWVAFLFYSYIKCTEAMSKNDKINTTNLTINIALMQRLKSFSSCSFYPILYFAFIIIAKCNYYAALRITWTRKTINILKQIKVQISLKKRLWLWEDRLTLNGYSYAVILNSQVDWTKKKKKKKSCEFSYLRWFWSYKKIRYANKEKLAKVTDDGHLMRWCYI